MSTIISNDRTLETIGSPKILSITGDYNNHTNVRLTVLYEIIKFFKRKSIHFLNNTSEEEQLKISKNIEVILYTRASTLVEYYNMGNLQKRIIEASREILESNAVDILLSLKYKSYT